MRFFLTSAAQAGCAGVSMRTLPFLAALLMAAASVQALEWPQFHADSLHSGTVESDFAVPKERWWSQSTGGPIEGSPVVSDGRVFIGSTDGKLYAFDAISGSLLWTFDTGAAISSTPALSGGILYIINNQGSMFALEATSGKLRLSAGKGNPDPGPSRTSPTIHQGRLYVGTESGSLIAYSLEHLTKDWEFRPHDEQSLVTVTFNNITNEYTTGQCQARFAQQPLRSSPAVFDNKVFFGSDAHALFAVGEHPLGGTDAGKTKGSWLDTGTETANKACPKNFPVKALEQRAIFPTLGDVVRAAPSIDSIRKTVVVPSFNNTVHSFDVANGASKWVRSLGQGAANRSAATPVIADGKVFLGALNGVFYALDAATGADGWTQQFRAGDAIWSSAAYSNKLLAFGADDETVYVLDALTGEKRWDYRIGGDVRSSPAIWAGEYLGQHLDGGVLYVGGMDGILYAFGGAKPPLPDLMVANIIYPSPPPQGNEAEVVLQIKNGGNTSSPVSEVKLYINDALASTQPIVALAPGETINVTYRWQVNPGESTLRAVVDPAGLSREFDRSNNELQVKTPTAEIPRPPPPPVQNTTAQEQQAPAKKKSPGPELVVIAGALALVAVAARRRKP